MKLESSVWNEKMQKSRYISFFSYFKMFAMNIFERETDEGEAKAWINPEGVQNLTSS